VIGGVSGLQERDRMLIKAFVGESKGPAQLSTPVGEIKITKFLINHSTKLSVSEIAPGVLRVSNKNVTERRKPQLGQLLIDV
jgi:hypothetical protein